jgi:HTH-type transcriptional regulator/antitoxin HigA
LTRRTAAHKAFRRLPETYEGLARLHLPRPIHNAADYANAVEMMERLAGRRLNRDQEDYLEALSLFVDEYERRHWPINRRPMAPLEAVKFLLQENGMSGSDLGRLLGNRGLGSAILRGDRELSKTHIKRLAERFKVRPGLFL